MTYTPFPIGVDNFRQIREKQYYYVDKTLFIKELLDKKGEVNMFTRPRRFGKTLNLSMLAYYFEKPLDGKTNRHLFEGLRIMDAGERYTREQEQYPVIHLTLKSAKQSNEQYAYSCLRDALAEEFYRHAGIREQLSIQEDRDKYYRLMARTADREDYITCIAFLSRCLYEVYQKNTIILIDEYDVPLETAYYAGFYQEMADFIRSLFESAVKTNPYLEFSVITGCLRISKESIFTGLNNLEINSILSVDYGEYFGFTGEEVRSLLIFYHLENHLDTIKDWYDGYRFGSAEVYNPWSVLKYAKALDADGQSFPIVAWANTSSNSIVRDLICKADPDAKREIEGLIAGGTIEKPVHEDITYDDIESSEDNLWNFLFFTGYLKQIGARIQEETIYLTLAIPNREVRSIYNDKITGWFHEEIKKQDLSPLYAAMISEKPEEFQEQLQKQLQRTISYLDGRESFYHGFIAGLLANQKEYMVKSNREAGNGRYDLLVYTYDVSQPPIILEFKIADKYQHLQDAGRRALAQIQEKDYAAGLADEGYTEVICYGIGFFRKQVYVQMKKMNLVIQEE